MRIRDTQSETEEPIGLTPLIDMVFLLLIFFLVATSFAQEERDQRIKLPITSSPKPLSAPPKQVIINILADGSIKVGGQVYTRERLAALLNRVAKNEPDRMVLIRADERSTFRYFAAVVALCRRVGIAEARIGYIEAGRGTAAE